MLLIFRKSCFGCLIGLLLAGCATNNQLDSLPDRGPEFVISGTIIIRPLGKPAKKANYLWSRGFSFAGWQEKISLENQTGIEIARVTENASGVTVKAQRGIKKVSNMQELFSDYLGLPIGPAQLAKWIFNQHETGAVPDRFSQGDLLITVQQRDAQQRVQLLKANYRNTIFLIEVKKFDAG